MPKLTEAEMHQAVAACDSRFDGVFFYAVKTTGIVCRPSCRSKMPKLHNIVLFESLEAAVKQGYRFCKRCRPDLLSYNPDIDVLEKAYSVLKQEYTNPKVLAELPARLGISGSQVQRLFKKHTGRTAKTYLRKIRIDKATELLRSGSAGSLEAGLAAGFDTMSSFYEAFRRETGQTPGEYRRKQAGGEK